MSIRETSKREPPSKRKEELDGQDRKPKPHEVGLQVPRRVYPKGRRNVLYGQLRQHLCEVFRGLAEHKDSRIEDGHLMVDHVHMMISIPPKYAVSNVVGYIKGKSAIHLAQTHSELKRNFAGQSFWARGYFVSLVGRDEEVIRNYIRHQEQEDERLEQLGVWR
jgi:putative transposase